MTKSPENIYLDHAATTPLDPQVLAAMTPYFTEQFYNPSALYLAAKNVRAAYEQARASIAALLGVRASELIFTAGSTEANNLAIHGVMQQFPEAYIAVSGIEHDSVLHPAAQYNHTLLPVTPDGIVDLAQVPQCIKDNTVLVSCMLANNEVGTVQPVADLAKTIESIRAERRKTGNKLPIYIHCDGSQAPNYLKLLPHQLGVDMLTLGGSKIYGPKQTGLLYIHAGLKILPIMQGGGQEFGLRSGTENVAGVIGLAAALEKAEKLRMGEVKRLHELQQWLLAELQQKIPAIEVNGSLKHRLPNNIHITIPGADNETLVMQLDEAGVQVSAGSACSASSDEPSHVLQAMGRTPEQARSSLRLTMGRSTTKQQLEYLISTITQLL